MIHGLLFTLDDYVHTIRKGDLMNITIRPWLDEDALDLYQLSMHPYYWKKKIWNFLYPDSFLHSMATIHFYQNADPSRFLFRAVVYENRVCGYLQCEVRKSGSCELSYWLGVDYWKHGIMKEAVSQFCEEAFQKLDVMMIYARVEEKNLASQHVLLENDFQPQKVEHTIIFRRYR